MVTDVTSKGHYSMNR